MDFQITNDMVVCLDGNFGLVHKTSSGHVFENQRKKSHVFADQNAVDSFVTGYSGEPKQSEGVNYLKSYIIRYLTVSS
jgi:hypothetical protein